MTLPVAFRRIARLEMDESIAWYESRRAGLGLEFAAAVEKLLERISQAPHQFRLVRSEVRQAVLHRFPYKIHFISEAGQIVGGRRISRKTQSHTTRRS